jgi:hypothetical protein
MGKTPGIADPYVATAFVTADNITAHFGVATVASLPTAEQARYNDYALQANNAVETTIYKYVDELPLLTKDEANTYAKQMGLYYALWLKAADDGANNVPQLKEIWENLKAQLIEVFKAQPTAAMRREVVSNGYGPTVPPYSQSYGLSDIL